MIQKPHFSESPGREGQVRGAKWKIQPSTFDNYLPGHLYLASLGDVFLGFFSLDGHWARDSSECYILVDISVSLLLYKQWYRWRWMMDFAAEQLVCPKNLFANSDLNSQRINFRDKPVVLSPPLSPNCISQQVGQTPGQKCN